MKRLWTLFVLTSACFYVDRVTIVFGCSDLLVFPGEINNSLSLALDGDCDHTCIVVDAQMNYQWTLDMGTDYFIHHVLVYLGAQENISQVPLLLDVGTGCCDGANFSKDCYVTYQPTGRNNNSLSYNCQSPSVSHARYLRLIGQTASPVEICEVQIFGCPSLSKGPTNEALFKNTTQISTSRSGPSSLAVDNNTDGIYTHVSCTHTYELSNKQFWWQVDLALALPVAKLTIYNRIDCCAFRLKNIEVLVGRSNRSVGGSGISFTRCAQHDDVFPTVQTLVCGQPVCGQYVRVVKAPAIDIEALTLCEVQVYTGTFDTGKPKTNELSVQTSSTSPTTPEKVSTRENSVVNTDGSTQTHNTREATPDETSEDSLSPLVDITVSKGARGDVGGETNAAPFALTLDTIPTVKNPQPSANDSSTQPSAETSTTTETGDDTRLTRHVMSGRDTAAETATLTSLSDNEAQPISSDVEFTEVTRNTATSTFVSVKATSGDTVMPAPMSVTDVTPLDSSTDETTTTTMTDLVSAVSFADQPAATVSTTTSRFYSTATTTGNEGFLENVETSAAMSDVGVSVSVGVADLQRSVSATNLGSVTSVSKLPSDMAVTDLDTLTTTVASRPDVSVTCHEESSCLKSVTSDDHFFTPPVATATLEHLVTKSVSNMELVTSDTMLPVSPVTFYELLKVDSVITAIPVSKMYTESQPIASEFTNFALVTNYGTTATTTTTQVNVVTSMPEETRKTSQSTLELLAVVATSTSSSPTTAQDFLSPASTQTCDFESTPVDLLVTVVALSTDVLMTHFDSLAPGLHQTPHFSIFTSPYVLDATNSGGGAVVDIVSTVQQGVDVVSSTDVTDATKVTVSNHGENTVRDVANSKDVFWSTIPSASRLVDSHSSGSNNSTDLSSLAISNVFGSPQPMTHMSGIPSVSEPRSKENDRKLVFSDLSLAGSQTTHVTGNVDRISLLSLPSASQVPYLWSSSEEYSQLSLSKQTVVLLDTITKFIPVLVESDESRAGLVEANAMPTATSSIMQTIVVNNMPTTSTQSSGGGNNHPLLSTNTVVTASEHVTTADVSDAVEVTRMDSSLDVNNHFPLLHPASVTYFPETSANPSHDPNSAQALSQTPSLDQASLSTMSSKNVSPSAKKQQVTAGSITWTSTHSTTNRPSTPPRSTLCPCGCQHRSLPMNTSKDYLEQLRQAIEDELMMPRADLAQQVMKKTSAPDRRASVAVFGAVAVVIMVLVSIIFVLPDLIGLLRWLHMCVVRRTRVGKLHLPA